MKLFVKPIFFTSVIMLLLSGCMGSNISKIKVATMQGDYKRAAILSDEDKDLNSKLDESNQLSTLYAGNSYLYAKDYKISLERFDEAERVIKYHNQEILLGSSTDLIVQLLLNDSVIDYHSSMTDGIMINTYKAIDYMALDDAEGARVEFNRAIDRQRRAKQTYAKLIQKYKKALKKKEIDENRNIVQRNKIATRDPNQKQSKLKLDIDKSVQNPAVYNMVQSRYPQLYSYKVYPDFINPFTNYLAGIFFATQGDYSKSLSLLKESYGMSRNNKILKTDFQRVNDILDHKKPNFNHVWIIYANGLAPKKEQYKINIPIFIVTDKISYTSIALPKMRPQSLATKNLTVFNKERYLASTQKFASMDRVILTEFKYKYNYIISRAIFGALIKTYLQYRAGENYGQYAQLGAALFQAVLTKADTRSWDNLPKEYQVSRVEMPKDKKLMLKIANEKIDIDLGDAKNAIIFVRKSTLKAKVSCSVIKL